MGTNNPLPPTRIIAAFPGTGKSWLCKKGLPPYTLSEEDASRYLGSFNKFGRYIKNYNFKKDYARFISSRPSFGYLVLIHPNRQILDACKSVNITPTIVYPDISLRDEYIERYTNRGTKKELLEYLSRHFDTLIRNIESYSEPKVKLGSGVFLSDVIEDLL